MLQKQFDSQYANLLHALYIKHHDNTSITLLWALLFLCTLWSVSLHIPDLFKFLYLPTPSPVLSLKCTNKPEIYKILVVSLADLISQLLP